MNQETNAADVPPSRLLQSESVGLPPLGRPEIDAWTPFSPFVLQTKIAPPTPVAQHKLLRRASLGQQVIAGFDKRITLITGSAGTGKTTLLTQMAGASERVTCWINLDDGDGDLSEFTALLLAAVQRQYPTAGGPLERHLNSPGIALESARILAKLFSEALQPLDSCLLIIDDFHHVTASTAILEFVERLVERLPPKQHIMISSRSPVPFAKLPRWRVQQWVTEIDETLLFFAPDEIGGLLHLLGVHQPQVQLATRLHKLTQGWIGLLILLLRRLDEQGSAALSLPEPATVGTHAQLVEFIAAEVLDELDPSVREFLVHTSLFEYLLPRDIDQFYERTDSAELLARLAGNGWFVWQTSPEDGRYTVHALLRDSAYAVLSGQLGPEGIRTLHQSFGRYLVEQGRIGEAAAHFVKSRSFDLAVPLLARLGAECDGVVIERYYIRLLSAVPEERITGQPVLLRLKAKGELLRNNIARAVELASLAVQGFLAAGDTTRALDACWLKLSALKLAPRKHEIEAVVQEALAIAGDAPSLLRLYFEMFQVRIAGPTEGYSRLRTLVAQCAALAHSGEDRLQLAHEQVSLANLYHVTNGEYDIAARMLEAQLAVFQLYGHAEAAAAAQFSLGICYYHLAQAAPAEVCMRAVLSAADETGNTTYNLPAATILAAIYADQSRWEEARAMIRQIERELEPVAYSYAHKDRCFAWMNYHVARGEQEQALAMANEYLELCRQTGAPPLIAQALANIGEVLNRFNQWETAAPYFHEALGIFQSAGRHYGETHCHIQLAVPLLSGASAEAAEQLRLALTLSRQHQLEFLFWRGEAVTNLLAAALASGIETEYVTRLIGLQRNPELLALLANHKEPRVQKLALLSLDALGRIDDVLPRVSRLAVHGRPAVKTVAQAILNRRGERVEPLHIQCFSGFQLRIGAAETPIPDERWRSTRAKLIFKYLLLQRRQPVHQEVLVDMFWPDADVQAGCNNLYTAIKSLRRVLQPDCAAREAPPYIICANRSYSLRLPDGSSVDYDQFDQLIDECRAQLRGGGLPEARAAFLQAAEVFTGEFLPDDRYIEWLQPQRQDFLTRFLDWGLRLGTRLVEAGFAYDAIDVAARLLERDPLHEDAVSLMMTARHACGHMAMARQAFDQYRDTLRRELGTAPSEYLRRLSARIGHKQNPSASRRG